MGVLSIGDGVELFHFIVRLEEAKNLHLLLSNEATKIQNNLRDKVCWLSYDCFGVMLQTPQFRIFDENRKGTDEVEIQKFNAFQPVADTFCIRSSENEIKEYFKITFPFFQVHICSDGEVLGTIKIDLHKSLFIEQQQWRPSSNQNHNESKENSEKNDVEIFLKKMHGKQIIKTDLSSCSMEQNPYLGVSIILKHFKNSDVMENESICALPTNGPQLSSMHSFPSKHPAMNKHSRLPPIESRECNKQHEFQFHSLHNAHHMTQSLIDNVGSNHSTEMSVNATDQNNIQSLKPKNIKGSKIVNKIEDYQTEYCHGTEDETKRRRYEWEEWRHQEELKWHEKLREKETAAMRALEEQAKEKEKERRNMVEASRKEYIRLETKLKKALVEVENKDRLLNNEISMKESELKRKQMDLDARLRIMGQENKYMIELERTKAKAYLERAKIAEESIKTAQTQTREVEAEFQKYKEKQNRSSEVTLMQEIAVLKGQLSDMESKIQRERAARNQAFLEKEQYRNEMNKMGEIIRKERERNFVRAQNEAEQLRLEYIAKEQRYVLDGDIGELQRIKNELNNLNKANPPTSS